MIIILIFQNPGNVLGQIDFANESLALRYRPENNIPIDYKVTKTDSLFIILFSVEIPRNINFNENFSIIYEIKSNYTSKTSLVSRTLTSYLHGIGNDKEKKYFQFEIIDKEDYNILFLRIKNNLSNIVYTKDIPLKGSLTYPAPDFYLSKSNSEIPILDSFINPDDSIQIRNLGSNEKLFHIYHYDHIFSPADPPMYRLDKDVNRSMNVDTVFQVKTGESFSLQEKGLYFIQSDTTSFSGISIRSEEKFYPKLTTMEDVIDPVIYLTTEQEIDKLKDNENQKVAFERFWLNLALSEEQAGSLIREYFDQVEIVNTLFTNFKPGWKTDMGMIYIIFGPPDEVYSNGETESWYYEKKSSTSAIVFNFLRLKSIFTNNHFLLIRDKQYKNVWFKVIDDWRRGRINR